jgi:hypothetical protein
MKKIVLAIIMIFFISSCGENTKDLVFKNFDSKKTELNLENKELTKIPDFSSLY